MTWIILSFKLLLGLKINLQKSEFTLVGEVLEVERWPLTFGCEVGSFPTTYKDHF